MQINQGLRSILALPWAYRLLIWLVRSEKAWRWFTDQVLQIRPGQKVIDIGCGPGTILNVLPRGIDYVGVDISKKYITEARKRYGDRATFIAGTVDDWAKAPASTGADLVMALGVLHHIDDDETLKILRFARDCLKDGGRFVFYEPCYLAWQSRLSVYFMSKDRGQNVRFEQEWKNLVGQVFPVMATRIVNGVNRLFYIRIIGECYKAVSATTDGRDRS